MLLSHSILSIIGLFSYFICNTILPQSLNFKSWVLYLKYESLLILLKIEFSLGLRKLKPDLIHHSNAITQRLMALLGIYFISRAKRVWVASKFIHCLINPYVHNTLLKDGYWLWLSCDIFPIAYCFGKPYSKNLPL